MYNKISGINDNKMRNKQKGNIGEALAYNYLVKNGYEILETNYKTSFGEIDVIATNAEGRIIFIEIKRRETTKFGYPREAVNYKKQNTIRRVALFYLKIKKLNTSFIRFDVIEILGEKTTHLQGAF